MKRVIGYAAYATLAVVLAGSGQALRAEQQSSASSRPDATAQSTGGKAQDKAQTARGSAEADPNVKNAMTPNDPKANTPAPGKKGGQKTRGMACFVTFDNYTPWSVEAYVDGSFVGIVPAWGDLDAVTGNGGTSIYARARFTDGSMKYWGPRVGMCVNDAFTWELHP